MSNDSSSAVPAAAKLKVPAANPFAQLPWGPGFGFFVTALSFVASQVVAGALFVAVLATSGWATSRIHHWLDGVVGQFMVVTFAELLALGVLWLFLHWRKINWRLLGYTRRPTWNDAGRTALAFVIYITLLITALTLAAAFLHVDLNQKQDVGFNNVVGAGQKALTFITLVLLPPVVEETLFRGLLFGGFRKKLRWGWAALFTSLLFALPHLSETDGGVLWTAGIDTFLLSMVSCYLREKTGALWGSVGLHMAKNSVAFLFLYIFVSK